LGDASRVEPKPSERDNTAAKKLRDNFDGSGNNDDLRRLTLIDVLNYASRIWKGQELVAKTITSETVRIIREAHEKEPSFFWDKSRKWLLGGLFYLIGKKTNVPKTQKQIAKCLGTDEIMIRDSYREWLVHFPEFWPENTTHPKERHGETSKGSFNFHSKRMAKFL
jgi:transcription initiation factor TFIIIB Brf1 subunit/transcription initiation factor TFIIB